MRAFVAAFYLGWRRGDPLPRSWRIVADTLWVGLEGTPARPAGKVIQVRGREVPAPTPT